MLVKITGFITFCVGLAAIGFAMYFTIALVTTEESVLVGKVILAILTALLISFSIIYYTIKTGFGLENSSIKKVSEENQLLRMQIEQQELRKKLRDLTE